MGSVVLCEAELLCLVLLIWLCVPRRPQEQWGVEVRLLQALRLVMQELCARADHLFEILCHKLVSELKVQVSTGCRC